MVLSGPRAASTGARYRGWPYRVVWGVYPRRLVALPGDRFGLNLLIGSTKR